ncbi:MAG: hypothetical protein H6737_16385 [Alphaproteobacteria bacterium]|nr:hypothetical protein [Alphaproteobacteria bacterium]
MVRALMMAVLAGGLVLGTACGGGGGDDGAEKPAKAKKGKKAKGGQSEPEERPPAKQPRPPFLSLSETDAMAIDILKKGKDRTLASLPQRGPFGDSETTTVLYTEPGPEDSRVLGGVVVAGSTAHVLPVTNDAPLTGDVEIVWASTEHGWQIVILIKRQVDGAEAQANQSFFWDGQGYVRDEPAEEKVATMTSPAGIRTALQ